MANRTATLVRNANLPGIGWRRGNLIKSRNGRFKPGWMVYNGQEVEALQGVFQIRTYEGDRVKYTSVGDDLDAAQAMLEKLNATRQMEVAKAILGIAGPEPEKKRNTLAELVQKYIDKKKSPSQGLGYASIHLYEATLNGFLALVKRQYVTDVTEEDVTRFADHLKRQGFSQKGRLMRYTVIRGFLRHSGVDVEKVIEAATHKRLAAKPDLHTDPYTEMQLEKLFSICTPYYKVVFTLLLSTGMRFREASHLTWDNVLWNEGKINVPGSQRVTNRGRVVEFQTKTRRGRKVPMFASLKTTLQEWRKQNPDTIYVVGTLRGDHPNNHWLDALKHFAREAGLNCGVCDSCTLRNECEKFYLHRFRHTFAHRCLRSGRGIHTVSKDLGHHDLSITSIYLSGSSDENGKDPFAGAA